tara:strand:+ start:4230 stop:4796 length:567 start_codon:yes stop_codon:yes gene_type:complete
MRPDYVVSRGILTPEECEKIINYCRGGMINARVGKGFDYWRRHSKVAWLDSGSDVDDLVMKCFDQLRHVSSEYYDQVIDRVEPVQFTHYGIGMFYGWHMDAGMSGNNRIISASVELSDPSKYLGGGLKFEHHPQPVPKRERGAMICFPSLLYHKARPVFWGARSSLVLWGTRSNVTLTGPFDETSEEM